MEFLRRTDFSGTWYKELTFGFTGMDVDRAASRGRVSVCSVRTLPWKSHDALCWLWKKTAAQNRSAATCRDRGCNRISNKKSRRVGACAKAEEPTHASNLIRACYGRRHYCKMSCALVHEESVPIYWSLGQVAADLTFAWTMNAKRANQHERDFQPFMRFRKQPDTIWSKHTEQAAARWENLHINGHAIFLMHSIEDGCGTVSLKSNRCMDIFWHTIAGSQNGMALTSKKTKNVCNFTFLLVYAIWWRRIHGAHRKGWCGTAQGMTLFSHKSLIRCSLRSYIILYRLMNRSYIVRAFAQTMVLKKCAQPWCMQALSHHDLNNTSQAHERKDHPRSRSGSSTWRTLRTNITYHFTGSANH